MDENAMVCNVLGRLLSAKMGAQHSKFDTAFNSVSERRIGR
jgi:hypothetical protein